MIDGEAGTPITRWNGDTANLSWVGYDVTSLPYRLRRGAIGIIGVGGGRDVLTALGYGNTDVTGIEINKTFIDLLNGPFREFAAIAGRPGVSLIHDEARSYLTRAHVKYDVLQMSLIDTWASTGAGAFTLTENGLYTREAWHVFLGSLTPRGVLSVSRWYAPGAISETTRLISLSVAALLDAGIPQPFQHVVVASAGRVATLLVSLAPFSDDDRAAIEAAVDQAGFQIELSPWKPSANPRLGAVVRSESPADLARAAADARFDFTAPSDERPFFFNMLTLAGAIHGVQVPADGVVAGNIVATSTLFALFSVVVCLVVAVLGWPLAIVGRPGISSRIFNSALFYFALIGSGFMFIQISLLQRFSVYLGHPTYTFSIVLSVMIVAAGAGSASSGRIAVDTSRSLGFLPVAIGAVIVLETLLIQPAIHVTQPWGLTGRSLIAIAFIAPLSCALGLWFPIGMRLVGRHSRQIAAWMWGVNGACGVLASILAVMVSLWSGIHTNLLIAAASYALLALPIRTLRRA
jgi:hypothetical protein